jgi:hypothetical protein
LPLHLYRIWASPTLLSSGYKGSFPKGKQSERNASYTRLRVVQERLELISPEWAVESILILTISSRDTDYSLRFLVVLLSPSWKKMTRYLKLSHNRFLFHPTKFIIYYHPLIRRH